MLSTSFLKVMDYLCVLIEIYDFPCVRLSHYLDLLLCLLWDKNVDHAAMLWPFLIATPDALNAGKRAKDLTLCLTPGLLRGAWWCTG